MKEESEGDHVCLYVCCLSMHVCMYLICLYVCMCVCVCAFRVLIIVNDELRVTPPPQKRGLPEACLLPMKKLKPESSAAAAEYPLSPAAAGT